MKHHNNLLCDFMILNLKKRDSFFPLTILFLTNLIIDLLINRVRINQISNSKSLGFVSCINGELPAEGSIGTIIYFKVPRLFVNKTKKKQKGSGRENDKKILEHQFGRDD